MSRTYKYPRESLEETIIRNEFDVRLRIEERLKQQKNRKKKRIKIARSFRKFISYRDKQRARV